MWRRGGPALAATLLLVLAVFGARAATDVAAGPGPGQGVAEIGPARAAGPGPAPLVLVPPEADPESWPHRAPLVVAALLVLLALAGLVAVTLWRLARGALARRRGSGAAVAASIPATAPAPEVDLAAAVRAAEQQLSRRDGAVPADAIIAAWLAFEDAAAGAGVPRQPHRTPTEFTADVLAASAVDAVAVAALRRCYQRARFGRAAATDADIAAAAAALGRIERSLPRGTPA